MSQAVETIAKEEYKPSAGLADLNRAVGTPDDDKLVDELFTFHAWTPAMVEEGQAIREKLAAAYKEILSLVPPCPTRTRALNALTDCRMLVNTAITFKGAV
ncbi:MAG TPA: hypothetical protein V6D22_13780 [Candidatus Obscuribacterales bacterium]